MFGAGGAAADVQLIGAGARRAHVQQIVASGVGDKHKFFFGAPPFRQHPQLGALGVEQGQAHADARQPALHIFARVQRQRMFAALAGSQLAAE